MTPSHEADYARPCTGSASVKAQLISYCARHVWIGLVRQRMSGASARSILGAQEFDAPQLICRQLCAL